jgi:hypothetical protein
VKHSFCNGVAFAGCWLVMVVAAAGCGSDESGPPRSVGDGGSAGSGASTGGTSGTAGGGAAGSGGVLRPPNPRTDIGPPDGVICDLQPGVNSTCATSEKCCRRFPFGTTSCEPAASLCDCPECNGDVEDVGCDGPEDCPDQLCCAFTENAGPTKEFGRLACAESCQGAGEFVVCKDPRDCLTEGAECSSASISNIRRCY